MAYSIFSVSERYLNVIRWKGGMTECTNHQQAQWLLFAHKPRTRTKFGKQGYCFTGPDAWKGLSLHLHSITDTVVLNVNLKPNCTLEFDC